MNIHAFTHVAARSLITPAISRSNNNIIATFISCASTHAQPQFKEQVYEEKLEKKSTELTPYKSCNLGHPASLRCKKLVNSDEIDLF